MPTIVAKTFIVRARGREVGAQLERIQPACLDQKGVLSSSMMVLLGRVLMIEEMTDGNLDLYGRLADTRPVDVSAYVPKCGAFPS
jgi:hypothetical protein